MKQRNLKANGFTMLTLFLTTIGLRVSTKDTKAITNRKEMTLEEDDEEEKDGAVVQCINSLIDKLLEALLIASIEVQRLGCKGKLKVIVIGGLPPPYPSWFEISLALELKTDSVENLNDKVEAITYPFYLKLFRV